MPTLVDTPLDNKTDTHHHSGFRPTASHNEIALLRYYEINTRYRSSFNQPLEISLSPSPPLQGEAGTLFCCRTEAPPISQVKVSTVGKRSGYDRLLGSLAGVGALNRSRFGGGGGSSLRLTGAPVQPRKRGKRRYPAGQVG